MLSGAHQAAPVNAARGLVEGRLWFVLVSEDVTIDALKPENDESAQIPRGFGGQCLFRLIPNRHV
jgi:hypothetical protein